MKICLYLEFYHFLGGALYKNIGTGLLSSYRNQKKSLEKLGLDFTEKWDENCNILQINTPWLYSLWVIRKARKKGQKIIIWSHVTAEDAMNVFWFNKYFFGLIKKYLAYAYSRADLVFCPSVHTKSLLINYGLLQNKLVVQSNGVDLSFYYPDHHGREKSRVQHNLKGTVVGTVGLVIPRKGVKIFTELAKSRPQNNFIWFGKIYSKLMAEGVPHDLPANVKFTGFVPDGEINADFNALDIFVFLSSEENQGMAILEATAVGLPILVKHLPAYDGWLVHNENCLIAKNNAEVEKYLDLLLKDEELRKKLSAGAKILSQKESIITLNKKLLETYQQLLNN
jgi:1,2-diacylglycerol-3-alpha-glucose alpha-1,2-glucosyltransferase